MNKKTVYFDNAATTPLHPKVLEKMLPYLNENFGNPSSIHSFGRKVRVAVEEAREVIAGSIHAKPGEIYFTSGGTEANNMALFGIAKTLFNETGKNKVISTEAEHHSILDPLDELKKQGYNVHLFNVCEDSTVNPESIKSFSYDGTSLVSVIHTNNETGAINDIRAIADIVHKNNAYLHSDMVQSFGKLHIDVIDLNADSISISSHKIQGPKGAGALYVKSGTPLSPIIYGGSQERNRRGGTENPAAIVGFAEAAKLAIPGINDFYDYVTKLQILFINGVTSIDREGIIINSRDYNFPYIVNITFSGNFYKNDPEAMLMYLDLNGVAVSNGAACTSGTLKPSHVILSMGRSVEDAKGTIRFSFGRQNTFEEVYYVLSILDKMSKKFRK